MRFRKEILFRVLLVASILTVSSLYLLAVSGYWKITPDSTTYVMAAESIAAGNGYSIQGKPVPVVPPVTSLVFSLGFLLFPGSYLALNSIVAVLTLCSLLLAFILFKSATDTNDALVLILMSLGSTVLFMYSTYLLSDVVYLFFSLLALVLIQLPVKKDRTWPLEMLTGLVVLAACMTRIVGLALVAAMIGAALISWFARRAVPTAVQATMLMIVMAIVFLWEYRSTLLGNSNFKLFLQNEPWIEEAGYASVTDLAMRFFKNLDRYESIITIFDNDMLGRFRALQRYFAMLALLFLITGLVISTAKLPNVLAIYTVIYLWLIATFQGEAGTRYFVPVLPFLFYYAFFGFQFIKDNARRFIGPILPPLLSTAVACYVVTYLVFGLAYMKRAIPEQHQSPFGLYVIKYGYNYDTQRLAMWLKEHSAHSDSYLTQHPDMMDIMTERKGYDLPLTHNPQKLLDLLVQNGIRYVLADKKKPEAQRYLFPVIAAHPNDFSLIKDEKKASLYRVTLRQPAEPSNDNAARSGERAS